MVEVAGRTVFPVLEHRAKLFFCCEKRCLTDSSHAIDTAVHKRLTTVYAHLVSVGKLGVPLAQKFLNQAGHESRCGGGIFSEEGHGSWDVKQRLALRGVGFGRILHVQVKEVFSDRVDVAVKIKKCTVNGCFVIIASQKIDGGLLGQ